MPTRKLYEKNFCLPNHHYPPNIHEYDIIAFDLKEKEPVPYSKEENEHTQQKSSRSYYLISEYPQTLFEPRALAASILKSEISLLLDRKSIIILFASKKEEYNYTYTIMENDGCRTQGTETYNNYSFYHDIHFSENRFGEEVEVCAEIDDLRTLLEKYKKSFSYEVIFYHPTVWEDSKKVKSSSFFSLLINKSGDIVSYAEVLNNSLIIVLPQIKKKEDILIPLFEEILPSIAPSLFPHSTLFSWKNSQEYWLPNYKELMDKKSEIEKEYTEKLSLIDSNMEQNLIEYSFLHDLITETDEKLVDSVKKYLEWLGFQNVKKMDSDDRIKEEDLQIDLDNALLIVEVKGIGGTSKDSDCNQINKIKFRRSKERKIFDVFALYIVNHQKFLPPKDRKNPPFSKEQISDAVNEERGLLTTWELFKTYFLVHEGIVEKSDIRNCLIKYGSINLLPDNLKLLGKTTEIFKGGYVFILNLDNTCLKLGDNIIVNQDDSFLQVKILSIQKNDKSVEEIESGEAGIQIDKPIKKNASLYIKTNPS